MKNMFLSLSILFYTHQAISSDNQATPTSSDQQSTLSSGQNSMPIIFKATNTSSIQTPNHDQEIFLLKRQFVSYLTLKTPPSDYQPNIFCLQNMICNHPQLLRGYVKYFPKQTFATICINTKKYDLLLWALTNNFPVDITTQSQSRPDKKNYYSTPLHSLCAQWDPQYASARAQLIAVMLLCNPMLEYIPNSLGELPEQACMRNNSLLSFQALKKQETKRYVHNPYFPTHETSTNTDQNELW